MKRQELLELWNELEPDRCRYVSNLMAQVKLGGYWHTVGYWSDVGRSALVRAIEEAIEARGWRWEVSNFVKPDGMQYSAAVFLAPPTWVLNFPLFKRTADDRVDALLHAYVDAAVDIAETPDVAEAA